MNACEPEKGGLLSFGQDLLGSYSCGILHCALLQPESSAGEAANSARSKATAYENDLCLGVAPWI